MSQGQPSVGFRAGRAFARRLGLRDRAPVFRDDGGTPAFRAQRLAARWAPFWLVVRFLWLLPLIAIGAALFFAGAWVLCSAFLGEAFARSNSTLILLFAAVSGWQSMVGKKGSLGRGPLWFGGMMTSPSLGAHGFQGAWGAIATSFRGFFVCCYAAYALVFWIVALSVLWAERAPIVHFVLWG